jgi:enoyl-CoA hydratase/carnithine racemase
VVIDANGDVFSAGADLKAFAGMSQEEHSSTIPEPKGEVLIAELFTQVHKPCIAKVHAPVLAGAFLIVCGCTHVVAADTATFSLPEVKRGIWPMQVMQSLIDILPARTALDLCMRGTKLNCAEAHELGLVTSITAANKLDATVNSLLEEIKANSPSAIRHGLKAYDELRSIADDQKQAYLKKMLFAVLGTADAAEGINAFKEKRSPNWTGN